MTLSVITPHEPTHEPIHSLTLYPVNWATLICAALCCMNLTIKVPARQCFYFCISISSSDDITSSSNDCCSKQKNQYPYDDVSTRPPQSDIMLCDSPATQPGVLVASRDVSTLHCDKTMQHVSSPVCLADRLKLRLAKTNKAHLGRDRFDSTAYAGRRIPSASPIDLPGPIPEDPLPSSTPLRGRR